MIAPDRKRRHFEGTVMRSFAAVTALLMTTTYLSWSCGRIPGTDPNRDAGPQMVAQSGSVASGKPRTVDLPSRGVLSARPADALHVARLPEQMASRQASASSPAHPSSTAAGDQREAPAAEEQPLPAAAPAVVPASSSAASPAYATNTAPAAAGPYGTEPSTEPAAEEGEVSSAPLPLSRAFHVVNHSMHAVRALYAVGNTSPDQRPNLLGRTLIQPGQSFSFDTTRLAGQCLIRLRAVLDNGKTITASLNACSSSSWELVD